jgi:hypothetical protein
MRCVCCGSARELAVDRGPVAGFYDEAVREALIMVGEASNRNCSKRLRPLVPILLKAVERHGYVQAVRLDLVGSGGVRGWRPA